MGNTRRGHKVPVREGVCHQCISDSTVLVEATEGRQSRHRHTEVAVLPHTSQRVHISHPLFWKDANGAPPAPLTPISHADVVSGKWVAADEALKEYAKEYTRQLEASSGKFQHMIWPEHCLIGSPGHCVVPPVLDGTYVRGCGQGSENFLPFCDSTCAAR